MRPLVASRLRSVNRVASDWKRTQAAQRMDRLQVYLVSRRTEWISLWRSALDATWVVAEVTTPQKIEGLGTSQVEQPAFVLDGHSFRDEDALDTTLRLRAQGAVVVVDKSTLSEELATQLFDLTGGLISSEGADIDNLAAALVRRGQGLNAPRLDYVTVDNNGSVIILLRGGAAVTRQRPLNAADDNEPFTEVSISPDGLLATFETKGGQFTVSAAVLSQPVGKAVTPQTKGNGPNSVSALALAQIDGSQLGARIRKLRTEMGISQAEVSRRTGIHRPNIARVEAGRHVPSLDTVLRIAQAIGVAPNRVFEDEV